MDGKQNVLSGKHTVATLALANWTEYRLVLLLWLLKQSMKRLNLQSTTTKSCSDIVLLCNGKKEKRLQRFSAKRSL